MCRMGMFAVFTHVCATIEVGVPGWEVAEEKRQRDCH